MKRRLFVTGLALVLVVVACQPGVPTPPIVLSSAPTPIQPSTSPAAATPASGGGLAPFLVSTGESFAGTPLEAWVPQPYAGIDYLLPLDLDQVGNRQVLANLTGEQRAFLAENGFVVVHSQESEFIDIRQRVALTHGQPYFLTMDAAFHALHQTFDELLKAVEREQLLSQMGAITQATLDEVLSYQPLLQGTSIEADARLAAAYLSVAVRLFDPGASIDPALDDLVTRQIQQVMDAGGRDRSVLFPDFEDDYGAYRPVGHYAGDVALEQYFRGMTWFGRVHFPLESDEPGFVPSRLPLIVTLALRRASVGDGSAAEAWATIHEVLTFLVGPSDDGGPVEYAALMDQVYGNDPQPVDLADDALWAVFLSRSDELPAPRINSTFVDSTAELARDTGWRFMGQRFTLDSFILQNLVFDAVQPLDGQRRMLPSGLDVMGALGSGVALEALEASGATAYPNYLEQMARLQQAVQAQPEAEWLLRFYDSWLYSFLPVLSPNDASYPAYMQTEAWAYREMNTALGSWTELKHDTILYTKMPEGMGGGGPPSSGPAPGYVEPNPDVFYRLAYAAQSIADGLSFRGMDSSEAVAEGDYTEGFSVVLFDAVRAMGTLASQLGDLGDIAVRELQGEALTEGDLELIEGCLGLTECQVAQRRSYGMEAEMDPPPIVAAVAGGESEVLEAATGYIDRIFVVIPVEGEMQVAQGGVYSYYEFAQPRAERLTDEAWRERLGGAQAPDLPAWASNFVLSLGSPVDWLAFRVGDVYLITEEGEGLNLRDAPSLSGDVLEQLAAGEYVEILEGPVRADGRTWWRMGCEWCRGGGVEGWAVEDQAWYERAHGQ